MPKRARGASRGIKRRRPYPTRGKRSFKKRKMGGPSRTIVPSIRGMPFADRYFVKLRYCDDRNLSIPASTVTATGHSYRINSLYDPDLTGVGHQPFGRDQIAQFYNKYRVFGVKYKWTLWNTDSAVPLLIAVLPSNSSALDTDWNTIIERGYAKSIVLPPGGARGTMTMKGFASVAKVHGVKKNIVRTDDTFAAFQANNPSREVYLHLYGKAMDGSTAITLRGRLELVFYCEMFDRILLTGS